MLTITKKPRTYTGPVNWYVADWRLNTLEVYDTKPQAVARGKVLDSKDPHHIVNVDWCPAGQSCRDITTKFNVTDHRSKKVF